jgi:hypothetical protein
VPPDPMVGKWVDHAKDGWGRPIDNVLTITRRGSSYVAKVENPHGMLNGTFAGPREGDRIAVHSPYGDITYLADDNSMLFAGVTFRRARPSKPKTPTESDCRAAYQNALAIHRLRKEGEIAQGKIATEYSFLPNDLEHLVRACVAGDSRDKVKCLRTAKNDPAVISCFRVK